MKNINWKPYLIITILVLGLYVNSLKNEYALDDAIVITKNDFTQKGISGIKEIFKYDTFTGFWLNAEKDKTAQQIQKEKKLVVGGRYRPLSVASFAAEISIFGKEINDNIENITYKGNPFVSHLINLLLYILTACLLYKLLISIFPNSTKSKAWYLTFPFIITILFVAHPVHTEAVANIKGRDEIMTLLGSLAAFYYAVKYCKKNNFLYLILSGICLFFGLLSKENAITFVAIIPLTIYYFVSTKRKNILLILMTLIISSFLFLIIRGNILGFSHTNNIANEIMNNPFIKASFAEKYATIFYTLWLYIKLLIFPHPLTYDYYPHQIEIINITNIKAIIPLIIYTFLIIYAFRGLIKRKKQNSGDLVSWSIWLFLLPLSVVSNMFFPVGTFMNERFIFISSIGFCTIIAYFLCIILPKRIKNLKKVNTINITLLIIILSLYSAKTISRNSAWKNDLILFSTDVKTSKNSAKSNCSAGGKILELAKSMKINDNKIDKNNLEYAILYLKPDTKKLPNLNDSTILNDTYKAIHSDLCQKSIDYLERSKKIYPQYSDALMLLANVYFEKDYNIVKCFQNYAISLKYNGYNKIIKNNIKSIVINSKSIFTKKKPAVEEFLSIIKYSDEILALIPNFGELYYLKGVIYGMYMNDLSNSLQNLETAEKLIPEAEKFAELYRDLGVATGIIKNYQKSIIYLEKALQLDSTEANNYQTYINLAISYNSIGDVANYQKYMQMAEKAKNLK